LTVNLIFFYKENTTKHTELGSKYFSLKLFPILSLRWRKLNCLFDMSYLRRKHFFMIFTVFNFYTQFVTVLRHLRCNTYLKISFCKYSCNCSLWYFDFSFWMWQAVLGKTFTHRHTHTQFFLPLSLFLRMSC